MRHLRSPLDGEGARRRGGRWNSRGVAMVYASDSPALATLEVLVYVGGLADLAATGRVLLPIQVPDEAIETLDPAALRAGWRRYPYAPETQAIGDEWARSLRAPCLVVPSAPAMGRTLLINPLHPDVGRVVVGEPVTDAWALGPRAGG